MVIKHAQSPLPAEHSGQLPFKNIIKHRNFPIYTTRLDWATIFDTKTRRYIIFVIIIPASNATPIILSLGVFDTLNKAANRKNQFGPVFWKDRYRNNIKLEDINVRYCEFKIKGSSTQPKNQINQMDMGKEDIKETDWSILDIFYLR